MYSKKTILDRTRGGLDILLNLANLPSSTVINKNTKVRFRHGQDTDKSGAITQKPNGEWYAVDFGDDSKQRDAISMYMHIKKVDDFKTALEQIALLFHIPSEDANFVERKSDFRSRNAKGKEKAGDMSFEFKEEFSEFEIQTIFAESLVYECKKKATEAAKGKEPDPTTMYKPLTDVLKRAKCFSLKSYTIVKETIKEDKPVLMAYTNLSNDNYPVFLFDYGTWKVIYQPFAQDKGLRFFHYNRPKDLQDHLNNLNECVHLYNKLNEAKEKDEDLDDDDKDKAKVERLDHIIICSGQRDAINVMAMGYNVVWRNSESVELSHKQYWSLKRICKDIYNLPDIDNAGIKAANKMALTFLDIRTILLPEELKAKSDPRFKKHCKDIRDYLKYWNQYDFKKVFTNSYPYQFWDEIVKYDSKKKSVSYEVNNVFLYNFIEKMGFSRYKPDPEQEDFIYIKKTDNQVKRIQPHSIKGFINEFLKDRNISIPIRNMFYRSPQLTDKSLDNINFSSPDFDDFDENNQWWNFNNEVWKIGKEGINVESSKDCEKFIWEDEIIKHKVAVLPKMFEAKFDPFTNKFSLEILNKDCNFFRLLINTSRVHWKEEVCNAFTPKGEEQFPYKKLNNDEVNKYLADNNFNIVSPYLSEKENDSQTQHLLNKIYTIGYILHRYRSSSKGWIVYAMDIKERRISESHGGSGKSLPFVYALNNIFKKYKSKDGRKPKLTEDEHIYAGVTRRTGYVLIDDAAKQLDIGYFYNVATGVMTTNRKHKDAEDLPPQYTPKIVITSNYQPYNLEPSKKRRLLFYACSDWYHHSDNTTNEEYLCTRQPVDDFGKELFDTRYNEIEWNLFFNFSAQCIQFYLNNQKVNPPMEEVNKVNELTQMGDNFKDWADGYFSLQEEVEGLNKFINLNSAINRKEMQADYTNNYNPKGRTPQAFKNSLQLWCSINRYELNPNMNYPDGIYVQFDPKDKDKVYRLTKKDEFHKLQEVFYISTTDPNQVVMEELLEQVPPQVPDVDTINDLPFD